MNNINPKLKEYIEENLLPEYSKNEEGHGINHIKDVIQQAENRIYKEFKYIKETKK